MTIPSSAGEFSVAIQPGKIGRDGDFDAISPTYYKMRAVSVGFGHQDDTQPFPFEVGSSNTLSGVFKQGHFAAGAVDILPRLKEIFGILLLGALGQVATSTSVNSAGTSVSGLNTHKFTFKSGDPYYIPWLAARRMTPGRNSAQNSGVVGFDVKVQALTFSIPAMGKMRCRVGLVGRDTKFEDASTWTYGNASHENDLSTPDSGSGTFKIGGVEYPITGAEITIANNLTDPRSEMIVGDFRPDDFIPLTRVVQIRLVYKYEDDDLCRNIYTGGPDNVEWSQSPFYTESAGSVKAFDAYFQSGGNAVGSTPYGIRFVANRVAWQLEGPEVLEGGGMVQLSVIGTVVEPSASDFFSISLENAVSGSIYTIPPALTLGFAAALAYSGSSDAVLDSTATLTDAEFNSFNGGKISLQWGIPTVLTLNSNDHFSLNTSGTVTLSGNTVSISGTEVGTVSGGTYKNNFTITLNANATTAHVQTLLRALRYGRTSGATSTTSFPVTVIVEDASGNIVTDTIVITHS